MMPTPVELLTIGYELLIGKVVNTNAAWLAAEFTKRGYSVTRITCIGDNEDEIASETKRAIERGAQIIVTTGGLGPTFDDITARSVSKGLSLDCVINEEALKMIEQKYSSLNLPITPERKKMAELPRGSKVLRNPVGTAPGFAVKKGDFLVVGFPGVPQELKEMFKLYADELFPPKGEMVEFFVKARGVPESSAAPVVERLVKANPFLYIKSHPQSSEGSSYIEFHVYSVTSDPRIKSACERVAKELASELIKMGAVIV
ncbi:hypothetical protein B9Q13_00485 [Candidatus Marsarchaeota G2 archaeon ECH_B_SAG-G16]|jgi:Predicted nucleotide-utilizing enzyme related to molybdopterin-biosynthesis enzyme MoeA|uniref:MoaB/Mog domain-containing protein n=4 Tax=Candidatus Marsarchaeota TaxID=1978152 RepID=A0A2R6AJC2_9ARCH|nr:MAG: hypothetical protein B9Q01_02510 [Candidatus Marsarchaeota G1 archaeon OSP_D]PSN86448.1 MAG: hypothetical protein B9Q02_02285 [Candidatus Marsarchaeota G1 archaeon BE_D]PSN89296.1 MAG: hypothetical protein B9Q00_02070 [Candidatus Marsarchaeota G1 archaeon OSP_C]PSO05833.1 MAG: hypothetical protein B9Q13_00485 [Candidatus Marsarchaeota G2 archaeon ECH_B_SAG-G16]